MQILLWLVEYELLTVKVTGFMDRNQFNLYLFKKLTLITSAKTIIDVIFVEYHTTTWDTTSVTGPSSLLYLIGPS